MKKILTVLCGGVSFFSSFASDLSSDNQQNLPILRLSASRSFEEGNLERERLDRIQILNACRNMESLRLAIHLNIVCEKFDVAETLLSDYCSYIDDFEVKKLQRYIQDEKIRYEEERLNQPRQRRKNLFSKILSIFKRTR